MHLDTSLKESYPDTSLKEYDRQRSEQAIT